MAQLTIYIDEATLKLIGKSSRREHTSVSSWVTKRLRAFLATGWPADYFGTFGSLKDAGLSRPAQIPLSKDRTRAAL